jgi:signal transduction protein with GAF and PtsI domain
MPTAIKDQLKEKDREIALLRAINRTVLEIPDLGQLLQKFCQVIAEQLKADAVLIYLCDDKSDELVLRGSLKAHPHELGQVRLQLGEGITGWVAAHRKTVAITRHASVDPRFKVFNMLQEDKYEAFLSVPITLKKDVVGVVNVQHRKAHTYSPLEISLSETVADEIAGALNKSELLDLSRKKSRQVETLARMSQTIVQGAYLREILQLIVTMTAEMMGSKVCSLMLLDEKGRELKIEATQSLSEAYKTKAPIAVQGSVSGRAIIEKKHVMVPDVSKDPLYSYPDIAKKDNLKSLLVVPMMVKDKAIGVLNCYTSDLHLFSDDEIQLLQAVANQSGIAIEHTRALEKAVEAQEALETRKVIERAKGILMREQGLTEETSFRLIQRQAMDRRKSMKEVAEAIILSQEIQQQKK